MDRETINVILASDENYAQPLGVTLYSLLKNFSSDSHSVAFTILDGGITAESRNKLELICKKFSSEIRFVAMTGDLFKGFPVFSHYSIAIYYRLIIPELFPEEVKKVIYLDCDILVLGTIADLYSTDIKDHYLAAVKDFISDGHLQQVRAPFYKDIKKMFNSGVLLMNIEKMRRGDFITKNISFIKDHSSELLFPDQESLNYVCRDDWADLDKSWNYQVDRSQGKIVPSPKILHYTNSYKPWHAFYHNYYQKTYRDYLRKAWPDYRIRSVDMFTAFKQILKRIPFSVPTARIAKTFFKKIGIS